MKRLFKKGFTLAEVLITLSIIGVISAVTLPALQTNVQKQALGTQIAKFYSQLGEGVKRYMADEGLEEISYDQDFVNKLAKDYLNVTYVCTGDGDESCFASQYLNINNSASGLNRGTILDSGDAIAGILQDGTTFMLSPTGTVIFDVNGTKGPNKIGYDLHGLRISPNGTLNRPDDGMYTNPATYKQEQTRQFNNCISGSDYMGCLNHLIKNNFKIDY